MSELHKTVVLEKADGLTWSIQRACGPAKEPGEAISPLRNDVPAAFNGVETANGQTASLPSQAIHGCGWVCGPFDNCARIGHPVSPFRSAKCWAVAIADITAPLLPKPNSVTIPPS
jgi:hypothetical protein